MNEQEIKNLESKLDTSSRKAETKKILTSGDRSLIENLLRALTKQEASNSALESAVKKYDKCEDLPESWKKKAIIDSVKECSRSLVLKQEANYLKLRTFLYAFFAEIDDSFTFLKKINELIKRSYFVNLESKDCEFIKNYLLAVFSKFGISDVVELLSKIKFLSIVTDKKPIIKCKNGVKVISEGITTFSYCKSENNVVIDIESIKITIGKNIENEYKELAIWQELTYILKQPIDEIVPDSELEEMKDEYFRSLMKESKEDSNKK